MVHNHDLSLSYLIFIFFKENNTVTQIQKILEHDDQDSGHAAPYVETITSIKTLLQHMMTITIFIN